MEKDEAKAKFKKADEVFRVGRFDEALLILDELDEVFPEDRRVLYPRARCLAEMSRMDEALQVCDFMVGKWDYGRARRLRGRILEREMVASTDGALEVSGGESEGIHKVTPIPSILADDDDDDLFEIPLSPELGEDGSPADSEPTPVPDTSDVERRYGIRIEDLARTPRPVVLKKKTKSGSTRGIGRIRGAVSWKPFGIVGGSLSASIIFFITVASFRGPLSEERIGGILSSMGIFGYAAAALLLWVANGLVIYGLLYWAVKMPYERSVDNALDVAIVGLVATFLLIVPVLGIVLGIVLVQQKYNLDLRQTGAHFGMEVAVLFTVAAVLLLSFSPSSVVNYQ